MTEKIKTGIWMKLMRIFLGKNPKWAIFRACVIALLLFLFRYHVLSLLVAGYDVAWMKLSNSKSHNSRAVQMLLNMKGPGVYMLARIGAAKALPMINDADAIRSLHGIVCGKYDEPTRISAWIALCKFEDGQTIKLAEKALEDPSCEIRNAAATVFKSIGTEKELPVLEKAYAKEDSEKVRRELSRAIDRITPLSLSGVRNRVKVAAIQFISAFGETEYNLKRLEKDIRIAAGNGARIVVLPETSIHGYMTFEANKTWQVPGRVNTQGVDGVSPEKYAETIPGPSTDRMSKLAGELGIYLAVPILEKGDGTGRYFNSLCLAGPDGKILLHYRKINPWPFAEKGWASKGDRGLQYIDTEYGRLALLICFDINFEPDKLRKESVDILLYSIAWVDFEGSTWFSVELPLIAKKNNFSIIGANWTVPGNQAWSGYGHSLVIERTGRVLAKAVDNKAEEIVYAYLPVLDRK